MYWQLSLQNLNWGTRKFWRHLFSFWRANSTYNSKWSEASEILNMHRASKGSRDNLLIIKSCVYSAEWMEKNDSFLFPRNSSESFLVYFFFRRHNIGPQSKYPSETNKKLNNYVYTPEIFWPPTGFNEWLWLWKTSIGNYDTTEINENAPASASV